MGNSTSAYETSVLTEFNELLGIDAMRLILLAALSIHALVNMHNRGFADSKALPRSTPEAQGVSSAKVLVFIETANRQVNSMHSFMLVRHGHVVAEA